MHDSSRASSKYGHIQTSWHRTLTYYTPVNKAASKGLYRPAWVAQQQSITATMIAAGGRLVAQQQPIAVMIAVTAKGRGRRISRCHAARQLSAGNTDAHKPISTSTSTHLLCKTNVPIAVQILGRTCQTVPIMLAYVKRGHSPRQHIQAQLHPSALLLQQCRQASNPHTGSNNGAG